MNSTLKSSILNPQSHLINLRAALFHSTPVLERKRRNHLHTPKYLAMINSDVKYEFMRCSNLLHAEINHNSNFYSKWFRTQSKKSLFRSMNAFADHLFQSWREEINDDDPSSSRGTSWFKKDCGRSKQTQYQGPQGRGRRGAWIIYEEIDEDEGFVDVERVFESIFGRRQHSHWSFTYEDDTGCRSSSSYGYNYWAHHHRRSRYHQNRRSRVEEDCEFEEESESSELDMASHRQALGLSASGPLKLEDIKIAYRACALKWHPDRHQGSSKAVAEEKFKLCSAAYQSLCNKLAVD